ncbi:MAG TPA: DUF2085 domain-containing protein [Vicinamibacterales bacterium]|nr:DUF2085 domain-containing protein [Vicinamibacterales bacterium]
MAARLFLGASVAWLALALLALTASAPDSWLSSLVFRLSSYLCHQQPDRTFHWDGAPWAVCARCLGLYAAAPSGALLALASRPRTLDRGGNVLLLCIAGVPTAVSWLGEHALGWPMANVVRFAAALPLGAAVAWVVARTLRVQYTLSDARRG